MNTEVHVSLSVLVSLGCRPSSGIAGCMAIFSLVCLRNLHTVLHSGCISLHSHQQCKKGSFFSTPSPAFIVYRPFDDGHSDQCEMIPQCGSDLYCLIMSDVEHLFMSLLAIWMSSLEKRLFRSFAHFWGCLFFWYWAAWAACIFWRVIPYQLFHLQLFSPIWSCRN